jgi:uncharacterized protein (TIRG00374 family)
LAALRWGIAIVGVAWVVSNLTIRDRVFVLARDEAGEQVVLDAALAEPFDRTADRVVYEDPATGAPVSAPLSQVLNGPDRDTVVVTLDGERVEADLAGMRLLDAGRDARRGEMPVAREVFVYTPELLDGDRVIPVDFGASFYVPEVPQPAIRAGLASMVDNARPWLLALAVVVFPVTLICTGLRWWRLMGPLGLRMNLKRAYALNMVGLFYNTFMLGSTGGDFIKAYYAGRHATPGRKGAAWLSVFVDRVIGLLVLVAMGGFAAGLLYLVSEDRSSQVARACLHVVWASLALLLAATVATFIALSRPARSAIKSRTGIEKLIEKTQPEPDGIRFRIRTALRGALDTTYDVVESYRREPRRVVEACLLTVPVHGSVILSAMLAGSALGLPIPWPYYFVAVPMIVLSASMPISPQGAGVMEFFAVLLLRPQGATVAQAFALALCIRAVQILWNLTGGLVVLRGGYGQPQEPTTAET